MSKFFREGWDFGTILLIIGLPIVVGLAFLFGFIAWEVLTDPLEYLLFWFILAVWLGLSLIQALRTKVIGQPRSGRAESSDG